MQPGDAIPRGGRLRLLVKVNNTAPAVTAGQATVSVYFYGWHVLTASGTMCEPPVAAAHRRALRGAAAVIISSSSSWGWASGWSSPRGAGPAVAGVRDGTCSLPGGELTLHHDATLPALAPRGSYSMRLEAADAVTGRRLMCVTVWFRVT